MPNIREIIARRGDLSTFLVHLCRNVEAEGTPPASARGNLLSILHEKSIKAGSAVGHGVKKFIINGLEDDYPKTVCFTETPLEYINLLTQEIEYRKIRLEPYGIAFPKRLGREIGLNPVWYVPFGWGGALSISQGLDRMVDAGFAAEPFQFTNRELLKILPFIEQMGSAVNSSGKDVTKEFWWEREWRHVGDVDLTERRFILLCPEGDFPMFRSFLRKHYGHEVGMIDPNWSLERIIAHLAGFSKDDVDIL